MSRRTAIPFLAFILFNGFAWAAPSGERARLSFEATPRGYEQVLDRASDIYSALNNQDPETLRKSDCVLIAPGWMETQGITNPSRAVAVCRKGPERWGAPIFYSLAEPVSANAKDRVALFQGPKATAALLEPETAFSKASSLLERGESGFVNGNSSDLTLSLDGSTNQSIYGSQLSAASVLGGELGIEIPKSVREFSESLR